MKVIENSDNTNKLCNIIGSGCLSIKAPTHTNSPRVTNKKCIDGKNSPRLSNLTCVTTKSRVFPERYVHNYDPLYKTTQHDEYKHPDIQKKIEKIQNSCLSSYSNLDESDKSFLKYNSMNNSPRTRDLLNNKSVLVGKVYSSPLFTKNVTYNSNVNWNNPIKK